MKKLLIIPLIIIVALACNSKSEAQIEELEKHIVTNPPKNYFYFIVLTMAIPSIKTDTNMDTYFEWDVKLQISDILELNELTEDEKYKYLDEYSNLVSRETLEPANSRIQTASSVYGIDPIGKEARIVKRKMHKFDSYKEASIAVEDINMNPDKYSEQNNHD